MRAFATFATLAIPACLMLGLGHASAQPPMEGAGPPPSRVSPFIQFSAQPHALRNASSSGSSLPDAAKPRFEHVVRTPTSRFPDIRRHSPGALYECTIPEMVRNDPLLSK